MYTEHDDEMEAYMSVGDPRRCPYHPSEVISSPCGMFDGLCGICEYGQDESDHVVVEGPVEQSCDKHPHHVKRNCWSCADENDPMPF